MFKHTLIALTVAGCLVGSTAQAYNPEIDTAIKKAENKQLINSAIEHLRKAYNAALGTDCMHLIAGTVAGILTLMMFDSYIAPDITKFFTNHTQGLLFGACLYSFWNSYKNNGIRRKVDKADDEIHAVRDNLALNYLPLNFDHIALD